MSDRILITGSAGFIGFHLCNSTVINFQPIHSGDVKATFADIDSLTAVVGFRSITSLQRYSKVLEMV